MIELKLTKREMNLILTALDNYATANKNALALYEKLFAQNKKEK